MPIDPSTYQRYEAAVTKAQTTGRSLPEVLDYDQLLLTDQRRHVLRVQALEDLFRRLEKRSISEIMQFYLGRSTGTPEDAFRAVTEWLETVIRKTADKTLEE